MPEILVTLHQIQRVVERRLRGDGHGIDHHAGFETSSPGAHAPACFVRLEIAVNHPIPPACAMAMARLASVTVSRQRNQRNAKLDPAGQFGPRIDLPGSTEEAGGDQQNIVKRQRFANVQSCAFPGGRAYQRAALSARANPCAQNGYSVISHDADYRSRSLREFVDSLAGRKDRAGVKAALDAWFDEARKARWRNAAEVRKSYATASIVTAERIVFNIRETPTGSWRPWISKRASSGLIGLGATRITSDRCQDNRI